MVNIRVIFKVIDNLGNPLPKAILIAKSTHGDWKAITDNAGMFDSGAPEDGKGLAPGDYLITIHKDGYKDRILEEPNKPAHLENPGTITTALDKDISDAITVDGKDFKVAGRKYKPIMATDFLLIYKKSLGQDIRPIIDQRALLGFDMVRLFTMAANIAQFSPKTYDVLQVVPAVLEDLIGYGMRAEIEGFADVQLIGLTLDEQLAHHEMLRQIIIEDGNRSIYDLCNEFDKNGIDPHKFSKPEGIISSSGSKQGSKPPTTPYWDFGTYHPRRDGEDYYFSKWRSDIGSQAEVYYGVEGEPAPNFPLLPDEPRGFDETNQDGKRSNYSPYAYQIGWMHSIFQNGACFHSTNGVFSDLFQVTTLECAKAFTRGCMDAGNGW